MDKQELKEIVELIEKSKIDILKIEKGDFKLFYQKEGAQLALIEQLPVQKPSNGETNTVKKEMIEKLMDQKQEKETESEFHQIKSPIIGVFFARPNPDAEPFVQVGSHVKKDETVCIIEAMKLLNEVSSDVEGEIVEILVEDGQMVEYGQPLFSVKVSG